MIFTLEALQAEHGDALLLHCGSAADPRLVMIDGGPPASWKRTVERRLRSLREALSDGDDGPLTVDLLMISHIDDDHIGGVLGLTREMRRRLDDGESSTFEILGLWHNAFEDLLADDTAPATLAAALPAAARASSAATAAALPLERPEAAAVVASVDQGRKLRDDARALDIRRNAGFRGVVRRTVGKPKPREVGGGVTLEVIGPTQQRLDALRREWNRIVARKAAASPADFNATVAAFVDRSVFNLASIVAIARAGGRSILLTGDARGDDMLAGLAQAKLLKSGVAHFDVFKLPHHGSVRNVAPELFAAIAADHYVVSANGRHGNPDAGMLEMLVDSRGKDEYTIHLTNAVPHAVDLLKRKRRGRRFRVVVREETTSSVLIDLGEPLPAGMRPDA